MEMFYVSVTQSILNTKGVILVRNSVTCILTVEFTYVVHGNLYVGKNIDYDWRIWTRLLDLFRLHSSFS